MSRRMSKRMNKNTFSTKRAGWIAAALLSAATVLGATPAMAQTAPTAPTQTAGGELATIVQERWGNESTESWRQRIGGVVRTPGPDGIAGTEDDQIKQNQDKQNLYYTGSQIDRVRVYNAISPSMNGREIPLIVITPKEGSGPRPTLYVLNGGDGGEGNANWIMQTNMLQFYLDKNINVVVPMEGQFSYYSDWVTDVEKLGGKQMWETFLTKELPPVIEKELNATPDTRAITGMSMTATTVLLYAQHHPGFYDAIGSFSGCAETNTGMGRIAMDLTLQRAGTNINAMWGNGEAFQPGYADAPIPNYLQYNDALVNAEKLRGQTMYISNGTGFSGRWDYWSSPKTRGNSAAMNEVQVVGGVIEGSTNLCTHQLKVKLDHAGIPADWNFRPVGTHQWGYWQDDMVLSWPTLARGMGIAE